MTDPHSINLVSIAVGVVGMAGGIAGIILNFLNKDRYQTQVDVYKPENEELRAQSLRKSTDLNELQSRNRVLESENKGLLREVDNLKELNSRQPDFSALMTLMTNNHKAMMIKLTEITRKALK